MKRRNLLSAVPPAALALSGAAAAAPAPINPDAKLLGLCAEFAALERKMDATFVGDTTFADEDRAEEIRGVIRAEEVPIVAAIVACRPTTFAGFTALASSAALRNPELIYGSSTQGDTSERLIRVLLRAMLGRA